ARLALLQFGAGGGLRQRQRVEQALQLRHALLDDDEAEPPAVAALHRVRYRQVEGGRGGRTAAPGGGEQAPGVAGQETRQQLTLAVGDEQYGGVLIERVQI